MPQSRKGSTLSGNTAIAGSERPLMPGTSLIGPLDAGEKVSASLVIRRRSDGPPMPDLEYWQSTPPGSRHFLTAAAFEKLHGAAPADIEAVVKFAASHGLHVVEKKAGRRAVVINGTAEQIGAAFGVRLNRYEAPLTDNRRKSQLHRGFEGEIRVPAELASIVTDVIGLDNRWLGSKNDGDPANTNPLPVSEIAQLYQMPNTGLCSCAC